MAKLGKPKAKEKQEEIEPVETVYSQEETVIEKDPIPINQWKIVSDQELKQYQDSGIVIGYDPFTKMALLKK